MRPNLASVLISIQTLDILKPETKVNCKDFMGLFR